MTGPFVKICVGGTECAEHPVWGFRRNDGYVWACSKHSDLLPGSQKKPTFSAKAIADATTPQPLQGRLL